MSKKEKEVKKLEDELQKDIDACRPEIAPILDKYNLVLGAALVPQRNGMICMSVFNRKPIPPAQTDTVTATEIKK